MYVYNTVKYNALNKVYVHVIVYLYINTDIYIHIYMYTHIHTLCLLDILNN